LQPSRPKYDDTANLNKPRWACAVKGSTWDSTRYRNKNTKQKTRISPHRLEDLHHKKRPLPYDEGGDAPPENRIEVLILLRLVFMPKTPHRQRLRTNHCAKTGTLTKEKPTGYIRFNKAVSEDSHSLELNLFNI
jgi:hypothetical protein